jgi:hypothetical protein
MIHACKKYGIPVPYWLGDDDEEEVRKGVTLLIHTHPAPTERILSVDEVLEVCKARKHGTETPAMDFGEPGPSKHDVSKEARDSEGKWTAGGAVAKKEDVPKETPSITKDVFGDERPKRANGTLVPKPGDKVFRITRGFGGSEVGLHGTVQPNGRVKMEQAAGMFAPPVAGKTEPADSWFVAGDPQITRWSDAKKDKAAKDKADEEAARKQEEEEDTKDKADKIAAGYKPVSEFKIGMRVFGVGSYYGEHGTVITDGAGDKDYVDVHWDSGRYGGVGKKDALECPPSAEGQRKSKDHVEEAEQAKQENEEELRKDKEEDGRKKQIAADWVKDREAKKEATRMKAEQAESGKKTRAFKARFKREPTPHESEEFEKIQQIEGKRFRSGNDEIMHKLHTARIEADPAKWKVGEGIGYHVDRQINRGFRIVAVHPDTKEVTIRQVADTGLTSSGGNDDRIRDQRVHIADLVRDNKYSRRETTITKSAYDFLLAEAQRNHEFIQKGRRAGTSTPGMDFGEGGHARHDVSSEARDDHGRWTEGGGTKEEEPSEDEVKAYRSMQPKNKEAKAKYWKKHEETFYPWMDAEKRHDEAHGKLRAEFDALPDKEKEERLDEFKKRSADLWEEKEKFVRPHREALAAYERLSDGESTAEEEDIHAGHVIRDRRTDSVDVVGHDEDGKIVMHGEPVKEEDLPRLGELEKMLDNLPNGEERNIHGTMIEKIETLRDGDGFFQVGGEKGNRVRTNMAASIILKNLQEGNVVKPESSPFKKDHAPQVAAPTLGKTTSVLLNLGEVKGKDLLLPGFEEYHLVAVPPGGSVAKHTKTGWEIYEKTTGLPVYRDTYSANDESQFHNAASMAHQILSMKGKKKLDAAIVQFQRPGQQS